MHDYRGLVVWRRARMLASDVYELTREMPASEQFELSRQMRRAAVSVPSNIAEGAARSSDADFARFIQMASGSTAELETQLIIAADVGVLDRSATTDRIASLRELRSMLEGLRLHLIGSRKHHP